MRYCYLIRFRPVPWLWKVGIGTRTRVRDWETRDWELLQLIEGDARSIEVLERSLAARTRDARTERLASAIEQWRKREQRQATRLHGTTEMFDAAALTEPLSLTAALQPPCRIVVDRLRGSSRR